MEQKMKAVVLHAPGEYQVELVDIPQPGYNEVLVEIRSIAICGSDPASSPERCAKTAGRRTIPLSLDMSLREGSPRSARV